jgi:translation initiation factor IF-2
MGRRNDFPGCFRAHQANIDKLLELIVLQAEIMELKANPDRAAKATSSNLALSPAAQPPLSLSAKGLFTSAISSFVAYYGRVRALINEEGKRLKEASPSVAVKVLG